MEHQLYRKYRTSTFENVEGQVHIKKSIINSLLSGKYPQSSIISGPSGTGKTTLARIIAKVVNCKNPKKTKSTIEPCNECKSCKDVMNESFSRNIFMIDGATNRTLEKMEPLKGDIHSYPLYGDKYKIFIIDEAHMLTQAVWNAFLTTIEEPPKHVIFMLCTTEPEKIIKTIHTRCSKYSLEPVNNMDIMKTLHRIYVGERGKEPEAEEKKVISFLAETSEGSVREACTNFETIENAGSLGDIDEARKHVSQNDELSLKKCIDWTFSKNPIVLKFIDSLTDSSKFEAFFLQMRKVVKNVTYAKLGIPVDGPPWLQQSSKQSASKVSSLDLKFLLETFSIDTTRFNNPKDVFFTKYAEYLLLSRELPKETIAPKREQQIPNAAPEPIHMSKPPATVNVPPPSGVSNPPPPNLPPAPPAPPPSS